MTSSRVSIGGLQSATAGRRPSDAVVADLRGRAARLLPRCARFKVYVRAAHPKAPSLGEASHLKAGSSIHRLETVNFSEMAAFGIPVAMYGRHGAVASGVTERLAPEYDGERNLLSVY